MQQREVNIDARTHSGETPLFLSTKVSSSASALKLLSHGADINIPNLRRETPLHMAARKFHDVAHELIKRGANVDAKDFDMCTPLHEAAQYSDTEMVSMLVYYGARADVVDLNGLSPFMVSVHRNADVQMQQLLMELEVDYNRITCDGMSTLLLALNSKSPVCAELIERGADVNYLHLTSNCVKYAFYSDEVFKKVWKALDFYKVYGSLRIHKMSPVGLVVNSVICPEWPLETDLWLKRMRTMLLSKKGLQMLHILTEHEATRFFKYFIRAIRFVNIPKDDAYKFICVWLWCGVSRVFLSEIDLIYEKYGFSDILTLFTHMKVNKRDFYHHRLSVPYLICDVRFQKNINTFFDPIDEEEDISTYCELLQFYTPSEKGRLKFYRSYRRGSVYPEEYEKAKTRLESLPAVPSLKELCRDLVKKEIIATYSIEECSLFYSVLKSLSIPNVVKHIISYKVPVNRFDDN